MEVKRKPPIVPIIEHYGQVRIHPFRKGWQSVRCCFHGDRNASASVNVDAQVFVCHGCGVKGDAYAIVMQVEGCDFGTAKRLISDILGTDDFGVPEEHERRSSHLPSWARARYGSGRALPARASDTCKRAG